MTLRSLSPGTRVNFRQENKGIKHLLTFAEFLYNIKRKTDGELKMIVNINSIDSVTSATDDVYEWVEVKIKQGTQSFQVMNLVYHIIFSRFRTR